MGWRNIDTMRMDMVWLLSITYIVKNLEANINFSTIKEQNKTKTIQKTIN